MKKETLGMLIILLFAMFNLVPPLFAKGGMFAKDGYKLINGEFVHTPQLYYDYIYFSILFLTASFTLVVIPIILPKIGRLPSIVSYFFAGWFFSGFLYEVWNLKVPSIILNTSDDRTVYTRYVVTFVFLIITILIRETWTNKKNLLR